MMIVVVEKRNELSMAVHSGAMPFPKKSHFRRFPKKVALWPFPKKSHFLSFPKVANSLMMKHEKYWQKENLMQNNLMHIDCPIVVYPLSNCISIVIVIFKSIALLLWGTYNWSICSSVYRKYNTFIFFRFPNLARIDH